MRALRYFTALAAVLLLCAGCRSEEEQQLAQEQRQQQTQEILLKQEKPEQTRVLRVTGCGNIRVAAELATMRFAFTGQAEEAEEAQALLRERMQAVRTALLEMGVQHGEIVLDEITVYPIQDHEKNPAATTGYSATSTMTVSTNDPAQAGNLIGTALQAGASGVQDIVFELLDETTVYLEALAEAVRDAADKADAIAQTAGLRLNGPLLMEESTSSTEVVTQAVVTSPGEEQLQALVEASQLTIWAQVTAEYEILS